MQGEKQIKKIEDQRKKQIKKLENRAEKSFLDRSDCLLICFQNIF